jgi:hypothetical protein
MIRNQIQSIGESEDLTPDSLAIQSHKKAMYKPSSNNTVTATTNR